MKILNKEDFLAKKTSNTLVIMGCGYSINTIAKGEWDYIESRFNTFGMNWFCNLKKDTTFYLIREQCISPKKLEPGSTLEDLKRLINGIKTTLIVKRKTWKTDNYSHADNLENFSHEGIVVNEIRGKCSSKDFKDDLFDGMYHGKCTMNDALHFACWLGYNRIIFCGVDLYDFRYFWLPYGQTRRIVANEGKTCNSPHNQASHTVALVDEFKKTYPEIRLFKHNSKSLLNIPVWSI